MGEHPTTKLSAKARIHQLESDIVDLQGVIDRQHADNLDLIGRLDRAEARAATLERELALRERDSWRPHR